MDAEDSPEDYRPLVIGSVDPYGPLQCCVRLLRRPSGDVIVINLAHAAADAFGLHTLMAQLLEEYQSPGSILPADGGILERYTLWTRELATDQADLPSATRMIDPLWPDPFGTSGGPATFHRDCISPPDLEKIRAKAKRRGGNLNDAVMAAYFLAMSDLTGHNGPIPLFFPVNLRQHKDNGFRVMSNQAANVCITIGRSNNEGMEEILPRVIAETKILKGQRIGIAEQIDMDASCDPEGRNIQQMVERMAALQNNEGLADIFISNPGLIALPDMEGLADAYVCYPRGYMPTTCFITSTFRGKMTVTMGYQDSERARTGTRKAMDLFRQYLLSLAKGNEPRDPD